MKAIAFLKKKDDLSFDEFAEHLMNEHAPFMRAVPRPERWAVNLAVQGGEPQPYDAVTEFWFADAEAFQTAMASSEVAAALQDGEAFVAPPGPLLMVAEEHILIDRA